MRHHGEEGGDIFYQHAGTMPMWHLWWSRYVEAQGVLMPGWLAVTGGLWLLVFSAGVEEVGEEGLSGMYDACWVCSDLSCVWLAQWPLAPILVSSCCRERKEAAVGQCAMAVVETSIQGCAMSSSALVMGVGMLFPRWWPSGGRSVCRSATVCALMN